MITPLACGSGLPPCSSERSPKFGGLVATVRAGPGVWRTTVATVVASVVPLTVICAAVVAAEDVPTGSIAPGTRKRRRPRADIRFIIVPGRRDRSFRAAASLVG